MRQRLVSLTVFLTSAAGILEGQETRHNLLNQDEVYRLIKQEKE